MGFSYTDGQLKALNTDNTNILVSAGAGSGKTAVLTARVIRLINEGVDVDRLVILTFTNAAAAEMKRRIKNKIIDEINNGKNHFQKQLDLLDGAYITTIDGFCLRVFKRYHYIEGYSKNIKIVDNVAMQIYKNKLLDELIENKFVTEDKDFIDLCDTYTVKNVNTIKKALNSFYSKVSNNVDVAFHLNKIHNNQGNELFINQIKEDIDEFISYQKELLINNARVLENLNIENEKLLTDRAKLLSFLSDFNSLNHYDDLREIIYSYFEKFPSVPRGKTIDEYEKEHYVKYRKIFVNNVKELKNLLFDDYELTIKKIKETSPYVKVFCNTLIEFHNKLTLFKRESNLFEFSDVARIAYKILSENNDIRDEFINNIHEIMLDEYQDTNDIQEDLMKLITNGNNLYMVGDVKQSIYKFRNAKPELFTSKHSIYTKDESKGIVVDLNDNFRSRKEVLDATNTIMKNIFDKEIGGIDYDLMQQLVHGNKGYINNKDQNYDLEVLSYRYNELGYDFESEAIESEFNSFSNSEVEAFVIAKDILNKVNDESFMIFNKSDSSFRRARLDDFTILIDRSNSFNLYKKVFDYLDIPITIHKSTGFVNSYEIKTMFSIVKLIYTQIDFEYSKSNFKHAFMSVARSFLFNYSDDDIVNELLYLNNNNNKFNEEKSTLLDELNSAVLKVKQDIYSKSITDIFLDILKYFNIYEHISRLDNPKVAETRINYFVDKISDLESCGFSYSDLIEYIDEIKKHELDIDESLATKIVKDTVNVMTIHKSKGLEFPVIYMPDLHMKFNFSDANQKFLYSQDYGIVLPFNNKISEGKTIIHTLVSYKERIAEISEKIRVLYVALTRAEEKIIMLQKFNLDYELETNIRNKDGLIDATIRKGFKSFSDILNESRTTIDGFYKPFLTHNIGLSKKYLEPKEIKDNISNKLTKELVYIANKYKSTSTSKSSFSNLSSNDITANTLKNINYGLLLHEYLEFIDFNSDIDKQLNMINSNDVRNKVSSFVKSDFIKSLDIVNTYPEYEFIYYDESKNIVNGIIDLLIETKDSYIIIDYKAKDISKNEYVSQLQGYKKFISDKFNKTTSAFLYSIIDSKFKEIK